MPTIVDPWLFAKSAEFSRNVYIWNCPLDFSPFTGLFRGEYVPSLAGKPKMFFIQACQGTDAQQPVDIEQDTVVATVPNESDTLVSLSTVPGYASNRSQKHGTWFISALCHVLDTCYLKYDLLSMLTMVNFELSRAADLESMKQIAYPSHTLRKQVYFNEGLQWMLETVQRFDMMTVLKFCCKLYKRFLKDIVKIRQFSANEEFHRKTA